MNMAIGKKALTLDSLSEALAFALEKNPKSHGAEEYLVRDIRNNPHLLRARLKRSEDVLNLLGPERNVLGDMGCGNAVNSVLALMNGAGEVHAVEMEDQRFRTAQIVVDYLGLQNRIHLYQIDVLKLDLPENCLDGAFSAEFLEHISDIKAFY